MLDYDEVVYMHANVFLLKKLDRVHHAVIRFLCIVYKMVGRLVLVPKEKNAHATIYCQLLPTDICDLLSYIRVIIALERILNYIRLFLEYVRNVL